MDKARKAEVLSKVGDGGRTYLIAARMGWRNGTNLARRYLKALEADGLVQRDERYSAVNDIFWVPTKGTPHG